MTVERAFVGLLMVFVVFVGVFRLRSRVMIGLRLKGRHSWAVVCLCRSRMRSAWRRMTSGARPTFLMRWREEIVVVDGAGWTAVSALFFFFILIN